LFCNICTDKYRYIYIKGERCSIVFEGELIIVPLGQTFNSMLSVKNFCYGFSANASIRILCIDVFFQNQFFIYFVPFRTFIWNCQYY